MTGQLRVLVTGASSGIGRAAAVEFARRGHLVFAAARREEVLADLAGATPNIEAVGLDVTDTDSVRHAWAKIEAERFDVRRGAGQVGQHLLAARRGEDQVSPPGELNGRRASDP